MILKTLWLRPLMERPLRFLATVLGVSIGVAAVVSTLLASRAAVASMGSDVDEIAGPETLEIRRPGGVELADLRLLRPFCSEALLGPVIEDAVRVPQLGDVVRILGVDLLLDAGSLSAQATLKPQTEFRSEAATGDPEPTAFEELMSGSGVALSRPLAERLDVKQGERFEIVARARPMSLVVATIFEPERFASAWDRTLVVDVGLAQELFGRIDHVDRIAVRPRPGAGALSADLAERLEAALPVGYVVAAPSTRRAEGERMVRALDFNLTALAGVSLLVGIVLVATTLATSVVQRRHAIALLRALGAGKRRLAAAVLVEAAAIGTLGGLLGVLLGWAGARASLAGVRMTVASIVATSLPSAVQLDPRWLLLGLAAGLAASLVASFLPLREALRTPPLQGLRSERPGDPNAESHGGRGRHALTVGLLLAAAFVLIQLPPPADRPIWALVATLLILATLLALALPLIDFLTGLPLRLGGSRFETAVCIAQAALGAGRQRAAWAASAVGVAVALAVAMATMVGSFRQTVVDWTQTTMRSDLFVRPLLAASGVASGRIDSAIVERAREFFGADSVDPFHASFAYIDGKRFELAGAEFAVVATEGGVPFLDGRPSESVFADARNRGAMVVNEPFARRYGVERGDTIQFEASGGTLTREVAGVYQDYSGHTGRAVLDRSDFLQLYPDEGVQSLSIFLGEGVDARAARDGFAATLDGEFAVDVLLNKEVRGEVLAVFERTFAVTVALQMLAAAVAAIAVVTVLGALVRERRRDLAVVRVLGGSRAQVIGVVVSKAALLGSAGALGGVLVGLLVGYILVTVINVQSFGWSLRFLPPWGTLLSTVGLVLPACLLAGLLPAFFSLQRPPREDLRDVL